MKHEKSRTIFEFLMKQRIFHFKNFFYFFIFPLFQLLIFGKFYHVSGRVERSKYVSSFTVGTLYEGFEVNFALLPYKEIKVEDLVSNPSVMQVRVKTSEEFEIF